MIVAQLGSLTDKDQVERTKPAKKDETLGVEEEEEGIGLALDFLTTIVVMAKAI